MSNSFKSPHSLMVQGTTSDAGKSVMVAAIARILYRHGITVAPFKPQNMALNSAVTANGGEIGRAQAVQAEACALAPSVDMNPILLKPNSDTGSQVIVLGKAIGNMEALGYHKEKPNLLGTVLGAHQRLSDQYQAVVIEGAGSPAEINLRDRDIANMGFAEAADCPVIIVADIDRGGVFAHLYGTYALLSSSEQARVKGFIINRFRGDVSLLQSGLEWLEEKTGVPVLAVVPYLHDLHIEAEDAVQLQQNSQQSKLKIVVIGYPRMSNHTDFDVLRLHPEIDCEFIRETSRFNGADLIILPGSKSVRSDLAWLKESGWQAIIEKHLRFGGKLMGICGGYQMLGHEVQDPLGIESEAGTSAGLGYLPIETELAAEKTLRNVEGHSIETHAAINGYEIHAGQTQIINAQALFQLAYENSSEVPFEDGCKNADDNVLGCYIHGIFDNASIREELLAWAGLSGLQSFDYDSFRAAQFDRLADAVEQDLTLEKLKTLLSLA